jgi:hypothetical protein
MVRDKISKYTTGLFFHPPCWIASVKHSRWLCITCVCVWFPNWIELVEKQLGERIFVIDWNFSRFWWWNGRGGGEGLGFQLGLADWLLERQTKKEGKKREREKLIYTQVPIVSKDVQSELESEPGIGEPISYFTAPLARWRRKPKGKQEKKKIVERREQLANKFFHSTRWRCKALELFRTIY